MNRNILKVLRGDVVPEEVWVLIQRLVADHQVTAVHHAGLQHRSYLQHVAGTSQLHTLTIRHLSVLRSRSESFFYWNRSQNLKMVTVVYVSGSGSCRLHSKKVKKRKNIPKTTLLYIFPFPWQRNYKYLLLVLRRIKI